MLGQKSITIDGAEVGAEAILLGATTSIGGMLFGYDIGQVSGILLFEDFKRRFANHLIDGSFEWGPIWQSLLVSLMSIGGLLGALSGAYTADWWGRRRSIFLGVGVFIVGYIVQITAMNSLIQMVMGRFVAGLGIGNLSVGVPLFQSETSPREFRGTVVASYQLMIAMGILSASSVNYGVERLVEREVLWRVVIGIGILMSLPLAFGIMCVPESPRWLASRGDWEGARMSVARLRGKKHDPGNAVIEEDLGVMRQVLENEGQVSQGPWLECFSTSTKTPKVLYRTLLGFGILSLQQWSGINFFFYFGATIFRSAGVQNPLFTQNILGTVNVLMTLYGVFVVERFGRRLPLFIGALWQAGWFFIFAAVCTANPPHPKTGIIMIVCACMIIASFAGTWGPMAWIVVGETFPLRTRAKQASLATAGNWLGNFMISFLTPIATRGIGYAFCFVFVVTNLAAALLVYLCLYESRALSLEKVDLMYGEKGLKAWNSSRWVPPGYMTRRQRAWQADASKQDGNGSKVEGDA
ncbi:hypothetical protein MY4824_008015 [Beauveria thailandica]